MTTMPLDPYHQLGIDSDATIAEIKLAYRRMAARHHPDKNPDDPHASTRFQLIKEAYEILIDPDRRATYDRDGEVERALDIDANAKEEIVSHFIDMIACNQIDAGCLIANLRVRLNRRSGELFAEGDRGNAANANLRLILDRFEFDGDDDDDVLAIAIKHQIEKNDAQLARIEKQRKVVGRAIELLRHYRDADLARLSTSHFSATGGQPWIVIDL